jgi:Xaa-Pro dipeptidase
VITPTSQTLVAYNMDGQRNLDEEVKGLGFDLVMTHWCEKSREEIVSDMIRGKKTLSDIPLEGAIWNGQAFYDLHYPLTDEEVNRYRSLGQESEIILKSVVDEIVPGMTENEVENKLASAFALKGYIPAVVLVGSDERNMKYRHPIPSHKRIERYLMLVLCCKKYGLHVPITRSVYFGHGLEPELARKYDAASTIAAHCIARSLPGTRFAEVLAMQKGLYQELGYKDEWRNHFQGGITGYFPNDSSLCFHPNAVMKAKQAFNWFITITGVNTEDTYLSGQSQGEILTHSGVWPTKKYLVADQEILLPEILCK